MRKPKAGRPDISAAKVYAIMAVTTVLTFTTLTTGYQLFFASSPFA